MLNILNSHIINIRKSLEFLINRGNVEIHELDINSLEYSDTVDYYDSIYRKQGNHNYIVFVNSKYYVIDCTTDKDTALIILNNINNITYVDINRLNLQLTIYFNCDRKLILNTKDSAELYMWIDLLKGWLYETIRV